MFGIDDAALGTLIAAGVSTAGQLYANKANIKAQQATNNQNMAIAAMNNATQIDMANSAHQREVADLRAAGLNPILSAGGSGAGTPSLQAPSLGTPHVENPVQHAVESAGQLSRVISADYKAGVAEKLATTANLESQNKNLDAQNDLLRAQVKKTDAETEAIKHPVTKGVRDVVNTVGEVATKGEAKGIPLTPTASNKAAKQFYASQPEVLHRDERDRMIQEIMDKDRSVPPNQGHSAKSLFDATGAMQFMTEDVPKHLEHNLHPSRSRRHSSIFTR